MCYNGTNEKPPSEREVARRSRDGRSLRDFKLGQIHCNALYGNYTKELFSFFDESDFESYDISGGLGTTTSIEFVIKENAFKLRFAEDIESMKTLIIGNYAADIQVYDPAITVSLDMDGNLKSYTVSYVLELTVSNGGSPTVITSTITDTTIISSTSNVTVPEIPNIDSYTPPYESE